MNTAKPSMDVFTINLDRILFEIEADRTLSAVIFGNVVGNTHVELAASEIEHDGKFGITLTDSGISFGRCDVWLAEGAADAVFEFLSLHSYRFYDGRNAVFATSAQGCGLGQPSHQHPPAAGS